VHNPRLDIPRLIAPEGQKRHRISGSDPISNDDLCSAVDVWCRALAASSRRQRQDLRAKLVLERRKRRRAQATRRWSSEASPCCDIYVNAGVTSPT